MRFSCSLVGDLADDRPAPLPWLWLVAIAGTAFVVRVAVAHELGQTALFRAPQLDQLEFLSWAHNLAHGDLLYPARFTHAPGYPYFLAALLTLFGGSLPAVRVAQAAVGAALCVIVAMLAARVFNRQAGLAGGALLAIYGPLVLIEISLLAEGLFLFFLALALWCVVDLRHSTARAVAAGALFELAAIVRATALPLVPALVAVAAWREKWPRRVTVAMVLAWLAVVCPTLLFVRHMSGAWLPIQAFGALNFYIGNRAEGSGTSARPDGDWDLIHHEPDRLGVTGYAEREHYFLTKASAEIRARPLSFIIGLANKTIWIVQDDEIREAHSYYFFRGHSDVLRFLPGFGVLFPLAMLGLWLAASRRVLPLPLALYLLVMAASCIAIIVSSRYRLPLIPALAALAGGAATWLLRKIRAREWRALAPAAAIVAGSTVLSHLRDHTPSHNVAEEWALTAASLQILGESAYAQEAAQRALSHSAGSALAWQQLGRIRLQQGDLLGAEAAFAHAVRLSPNYQYARLHLGMTRRRRGDLDGALRELRHSLWLAPYDPGTLAELAEILLTRGEAHAAEPLLRRLLQVDPRNAGARRALTRIERAARMSGDAVDRGHYAGITELQFKR